MMNNHHNLSGLFFEMMASVLSVLIVVSHIAQILAPIATLILSSLLIFWWSIRIDEWRRHGQTGDDHDRHP